MVSMFMVAIPVSTVIGSPLSTSILYMDGFLGLRGWQWVFISEAIPARILSVVTWFYMRDHEMISRSKVRMRVVTWHSLSTGRLLRDIGLPAGASSRAKISHVLPLLLESRD
jgi:MFS family permease